MGKHKLLNPGLEIVDVPSRVAVLHVTPFAVPGEVVHGLQDLLPLAAALSEVSSSSSSSPGGGVVRVQNHALAADSIGV